MRFFILAPGPSMSQSVADAMKGLNVGAVNNCYELAPWADFLAATDAAWWAKNPAALDFAGKKFTAATLGVEYRDRVKRISTVGVYCNSNSGVLALECAKVMGAREIVLLGFDMHGTHYFGAYTNGLSNTSESRRTIHHRQFLTWKLLNPEIKVINCTPNTALKHFKTGNLNDWIP